MRGSGGFLGFIRVYWGFSGFIDKVLRSQQALPSPSHSAIGAGKAESFGISKLGFRV